MDLINESNLDRLEAIFNSVCPVLNEKIRHFKEGKSIYSHRGSNRSEPTVVELLYFINRTLWKVYSCGASRLLPQCTAWPTTLLPGFDAHYIVFCCVLLPLCPCLS